MRTAPLAAVVLVALAGCRSEPSRSPGDAGAVDVPPDAAQPPAAGKPPLPSQQTRGSGSYTIVPGVRVGPVRLGMPFDSVLVTLGQPPRSDAGMGKVWGAWHGWGNAHDAWVDVFAVADQGNGAYLVTQIRVDGPAFHTEDDLPANARRADVVRRYPAAKAVRGTNLYDNRRGIGFVFASTADSARAVAVYIVPPGTPSALFHPRPDEQP